MFDLVHDIAGGYRELIDANSYPGEICSMKKYTKNMNLKSPFYKATAILMYMLIDAEVTFAVIGDVHNNAVEFVSGLTYGKQVGIEEADFIFILADASFNDKQRALEKAKVGTLIDPHISATIICEVESVNQGKVFYLDGPGINDLNTIYLDFFEGWSDIRQIKNKEFPLGIDMIFVDGDSNFIALPRTTKLKERV